MSELTSPRRTVLRSAAWATPVVAFAAAAPAASASEQLQITITEVTCVYEKMPDPDPNYKCSVSALVSLVAGTWPTGGVAVKFDFAPPPNPRFVRMQYAFHGSSFVAAGRVTPAEATWTTCTAGVYTFVPDSGGVLLDELASADPVPITRAGT